MNKQLLPAIVLLIIITITACGGQSLPTATKPAPTTTAESQPTQPPAAAPTATETATATPAATEVPAPVSFAVNIKPILDARCIKCHGVEQIKEGLDLQTYDNLMAGSRNGTVIEPGSADNSFLVQLIVRGKMPNRGPKVTPEELQLIRDWIDQGALNN